MKGTDKISSMKILLPIFFFLVMILTVSLLQWMDVVHVPCVQNKCLLGGVCTIYNKKTMCLNARNVNELCEHYCSNTHCEVGITKPIVINCK